MGKEGKDVERKEGGTPRRKKKEDNQVTERVEGREVEGGGEGEREREESKGKGRGGRREKKGKYSIGL